MKSNIARIALLAALMLPVGSSMAASFEAETKVAAADPKKALTADEILKEAGGALFPENFTAQLEMTQHKPGAKENTSRLMLYKKGMNQVRADYVFPPLQAGQKMLRKEGQIWMYMPDTKRAIKLSPKQSLGGSDFNNGDIMRLNLVEDYIPTILSEDANQWVLELKAKDRTVSYDKILYTVEKKGLKSIKQEFYSLNGKLIKSLEFSEYKDYTGLKRPSVFLMKSALAEGVYTTMKYLQFEPSIKLSDADFRQDALARQ